MAYGRVTCRAVADTLSAERLPAFSMGAPANVRASARPLNRAPATLQGKLAGPAGSSTATKQSVGSSARMMSRVTALRLMLPAFAVSSICMSTRGALTNPKVFRVGT